MATMALHTSSPYIAGRFGRVVITRVLGYSVLSGVLMQDINLPGECQVLMKLNRDVIFVLHYCGIGAGNRLANQNLSRAEQKGTAGGSPQPPSGIIDISDCPLPMREVCNDCTPLRDATDSMKRLGSKFPA